MNISNLQFQNNLSFISSKNVDITQHTSVHEMSTGMLMAMFQQQLNQMDDSLQVKLDAQTDAVATEKALSDVQNIISKYSGKDYSKDDGGDQNNLIKMANDVNNAINEYASSPNASPGMVAQMRDAATAMNKWKDAAKKFSEDASQRYDVPKAYIQSASDAYKNMGDALKKDSELKMTDVQDMVSKRAQAIQLMTNMIQAINDSLKGIVGQIGK